MKRHKKHGLGIKSLCLVVVMASQVYVTPLNQNIKLEREKKKYEPEVLRFYFPI